MRRAALVLSITVMLVGTVVVISASANGSQEGLGSRTAHKYDLSRNWMKVPQVQCALDQGTISGLRNALKCVNGNLNRLYLSFNKMIGTCLYYQKQKQYSGYVYDNQDGQPTILTTALDFAKNGDWALFWKANCNIPLPPG